MRTAILRLPFVYLYNSRPPPLARSWRADRLTDRSKARHAASHNSPPWPPPQPARSALTSCDFAPIGSRFLRRVVVLREGYRVRVNNYSTRARWRRAIDTQTLSDRSFSVQLISMLPFPMRAHSQPGRGFFDLSVVHNCDCDVTATKTCRSFNDVVIESYFHLLTSISHVEI